MSDLRRLFRGIAVLIDDEIENVNSEIGQLAKQIEAENCHVIGFPDLPTDAQLDTLNETSFFILDWMLHDIHSEAGVPGNVPLLETPRGLAKAYVKANLDFLKKIRERRFAPVFIFTNQEPATVKKALSDAKLFSDSPRDHIFVQGKAAVLEGGIFQILTEWIKSHPSAYVLKCWEAAYAKTRNEFFVDFYSLSHLWPVVLWKTYSDDNVSEAAELTSMISRNILSRLAPVQFDASIVAAPNHLTAEVEPKEVRKVLEGERFIHQTQLQTAVSVGDVFKNRAKYFVNVRPECDCVPRNGKSVDDVLLYLIQGDKVNDKKFHEIYKSDLGIVLDKDTTGTIFAMYNDVTVRFQFQKLQIVKWGDWKSKRVGRLIPPYITKLQQRFGAFIQRTGLARIPTQAVSKREIEIASESNDNIATIAQSK